MTNLLTLLLKIMNSTVTSATGNNPVATATVKPTNHVEHSDTNLTSMTTNVQTNTEMLQGIQQTVGDVNQTMAKQQATLMQLTHDHQDLSDLLGKVQDQTQDLTENGAQHHDITMLADQLTNLKTWLAHHELQASDLTDVKDDVLAQLGALKVWLTDTFPQQDRIDQTQQIVRDLQAKIDQQFDDLGASVELALNHANEKQQLEAAHRRILELQNGQAHLKQSLTLADAHTNQFKEQAEDERQQLQKLQDKYDQRELDFKQQNDQALQENHTLHDKLTVQQHRASMLHDFAIALLSKITVDYRPNMLTIDAYKELPVEMRDEFRHGLAKTTKDAQLVLKTEQDDRMQQDLQDDRSLVENTLKDVLPQEKKDVDQQFDDSALNEDVEDLSKYDQTKDYVAPEYTDEGIDVQQDALATDNDDLKVVKDDQSTEVPATAKSSEPSDDSKDAVVDSDKKTMKDQE